MNKIYLLGEINETISLGLKGMGLVPTNSREDNDSVKAIIVRGELPVDRNLITKFTNLKIIVSAGIGFDNIDIKTAQEKGIFVANCPYANSISTAEHAVSMLLAGMKNITKSNIQLREGRWDRSNNVGVQAFGQKIGIVGLGRIGRYSSQLCDALGMDVYAFDPFVPNYHFIRSRARRLDSLDSLFNTVNFTLIHLPRTNETANIIGIKLLKLLRKPNGVVNTCRGGIVNEKDMLNLLNKNSIDFYATDVFINEPHPDKALISHEKVIATPHIAANTTQAQEQVAEDVLLQIKQVLIQGKSPAYLINEEHL